MPFGKTHWARFEALENIMHGQIIYDIAFKYIRNNLLPFLLIICIIVLGSISRILSFNELHDASEDIYNRLLFIMIGSISLVYMPSVLRYYFKRLRIVDIAFILFVITFLIGMESWSIYDVAPMLRLLFCFYFLSFFLKEYVPQRSHVFLISIILLIVVLYFLMNIGFSYSERLKIGKTATSPSRYFFIIMCSAYYIAYFARYNNKNMVKWFCFIIIITSFLLLIKTGTRQGLLGIFLLLSTYFILAAAKTKITIHTYFNYIILFITLLMAIIVAYLFIPHELLERILSYSWDSSMEGRSLRYEYALGILKGNFYEYLFKGFHLGKNRFRYGGMWIGSSFHNIYLVYLNCVGLLSTFFLFLFHMTIFYSIFKNYFTTKFTSVVETFSTTFFISICLTIYAMSLIGNFMFFVSSIEAYVFYIILGMLVNKRRDREHERKNDKYLLNARPASSVANGKSPSTT